MSVILMHIYPQKKSWIEKRTTFHLYEYYETKLEMCTMIKLLHLSFYHSFLIIFLYLPTLFSTLHSSCTFYRICIENTIIFYMIHRFYMSRIDEIFNWIERLFLLRWFMQRVSCFMWKNSLLRMKKNVTIKIISIAFVENFFFPLY